MAEQALKMDPFSVDLKQSSEEATQGILRDLLSGEAMHPHPASGLLCGPATSAQSTSLLAAPSTKMSSWLSAKSMHSLKHVNMSSHKSSCDLRRWHARHEMAAISNSHHVVFGILVTQTLHCTETAAADETVQEVQKQTVA